METFNLKFCVEDSTFAEGNTNKEIALILKDLAVKMEFGPNHSNSIRDAEGNRIGSWYLEVE